MEVKILEKFIENELANHQSGLDNIDELEKKFRQLINKFKTSDINSVDFFRNIKSAFFETINKEDDLPNAGEFKLKTDICCENNTLNDKFFYDVIKFKEIVEYLDQNDADDENLRESLCLLEGEPTEMFEKYKERGDEYFEVARDYAKCLQGKYDELKAKKESQMKNLRKYELENQMIAFSLQAYENYKQACSVADRLENMEAQISLRSRLIDCLINSGHYFEAQFIKISQLILIKIKNGTKSQYECSANDLRHIKNLICCKYSLSELENLELRMDSKNEENNFYLTPSRTNLANLQVPVRHLMYQAKIRNSLSIFKASACKVIKTMLFIFVLSLFSILFEKFEFIIFWFDSFSIFVTFAMLIILILCFEVFFYVKNQSKSIKKLKTNINNRLRFNKDLECAFKQFQRGKYNEFLKNFMQSIDEGIEPKKIVQTLLKLEMSPDNIAFLLCLVSEALFLSNESNSSNKVHDVLNELVVNEDLIKNAFELDRQFDLYIAEKSVRYGKNHHIKTKEEYVLLEERRNDALNFGSFSGRLDDLRSIAKSNLIIMQLKNVTKANEINKCLKELSVPSNEFINNKKQISRLQFLRWIFKPNNTILPCLASVQNSKKLNAVNSSKQSGFYQISLYETYLENLLLKELNDERRVYVLNKKGHFLYAKAETLSSPSESFLYFRKAYITHLKSYALEKVNNKDAAIGILKGSLKLNRFGQTLTHFNEFFINNYEFYSRFYEIWLCAGIACYKRNKLDIAKTYLVKADEMKSTHITQRYLQIVLNMIQKKKEQKTAKDVVTFYTGTQANFLYLHVKNSQYNSEAKPKYKIVSIDGGGVRGVIPAMLLSEVERRTHKPLASLVDLFAGTSTGAMICACLTMSKQPGSTLPLFYASDTINFYVNKAYKIFKNPLNFFQPQYYKYKYADSNRKSVLTEIFTLDGKERFMNETLTDLYIPAMNASNTSLIHEFTKYNSSRYLAENYSIVDVLMATSAAPVYFKPYTIESTKQTFIDGGLITTSPARRAYEYAICKRQVDPRDIFTFSLGTGDFLDSSLDREQPKSLYYWMRNIAKTIISGGGYDVDYSMRNLLGERYQRWQIFFEQPIQLDNHTRIPVMLDMCNQFIEENDDAINEIVKIFDE